MDMDTVTQRDNYSRVKRILVVDDDAATRKITTWILLGLGYEVICCDNGADAFEKLIKSPHAFKMVITGAHPNDFSGIDLIKSLRHISVTAHLPILLMAYNPLMELVLAEHNLPNTSFAPKPIHEALLKQEIQRLLTGEVILEDTAV